MTERQTSRGRLAVEAIGLVALVLSLGFVGLEIRQNTMAARAAAYQSLGTHLSQQYLEAARDPEFMSLFTADSVAWESLGEVERSQLAFAWIATLRTFETVVLQIEQGLLDESAVSSLGWEAFEPSYTFRQLWPEIARSLGSEFRVFMEERYPSLPKG